MNMLKPKRLQQAGMASIIVTMIIMVVLGLVILGFARVVNREQVQTADRQLSTQAFYAAESGVNKAINDLKANPNLPEVTTCGGLVELVPGSGIGYSCVLMDPTPTSYDVGNVGIDDAIVIPIEREGGGAISTVSVGWEEKSGATGLGCPAAGNLPVSWPGGCAPGMLRIDAVAMPGGAIDRNSLRDARTATIFAQPVSGGSGNATTAAGSASLAQANCGPAASGVTPRQCDLQINLGGLPASNKFYLRIRSLYKANRLTICAPDCGPGAYELVGFQAIIDSTGKASDILRRIQVRAPIYNLAQQSFPTNSLETGAGICKRLGIVRATPSFPTPSLRNDLGSPSSHDPCGYSI